MKKNITTILFLCTAFAYSCKKPGTPNIPVNSDMRQAFSFKPGSYWIYLDSISGKTDSFFITGFADEYAIPDNGQTHDLVLMLMCNIDSTTSNIDTNIWQIELIINRIDLTNKVNLGYSLGFTIVGYYPLINFPFNEKLTVSNPIGLPEYSGKTTITLYNNYSVLSENYKNVACINDSASSFVPVLPNYVSFSQDNTICFSYNNTFCL